jgi:hypothetical protein
MPSVALSVREMIGAARELVVVGDNDESGVGQKCAQEAATKASARLVIPPEQGDVNDYVAAGLDLGALLSPPKTGWVKRIADFASAPAPISWLVKRWLQSQALIMVHGPSGGGKTFVVLDWCLRMAAGFSDWAGVKVSPGCVVYLAGEGHHGLRGRIAAWKHHNSAGPLRMWLSRDGCDLNTPGGYSHAAVNIAALPVPPQLIVVDTLHRFLSGDENSAQDAKTMLDACAGLMREFSCSVLLVHHTGVNEDVQHRARGSSAWRGALDIEISVVPGKKGAPIQVVQRKSKDAEIAAPVSLELKPVEIPGWLDEDGLPVTSAVTVVTEAVTEAPKRESKHDVNCRMWGNAWLASGAEDRGGRPYISKSALMDYLISTMELTEASARQYVKPSVPDKLVGALTLVEFIAPFEHGWIVTNGELSSQLMLKKQCK